MNFTLGLANGGFLSGIGAANRGLGSLLSTAGKLTTTLGAITGLGAGFAGVLDAITNAGDLADLSARTDESVQNLVKLQHAFKQVGLPASAVVPTITQIQKALGGVNENGEPTVKAFEDLGLSIDQLKGKNAPEQISLIGAALAKLPKEQATSLAAKIVGRGGAGDLLQLARQAEDVNAALKQAEPQAAIFARIAESSNKLGKTLGAIKLQGKGLFAGIAEGALPGLQSLSSALAQFDLTGLGVTIGKFIGAIGQAFKEGQLGNLISLSFAAGFEQSYQIFQTFIRTLGEGISLTLGSGDIWVGFLNAGFTAIGSLVNELMDMLTPIFAFGKTTLTLQSGDRTWEEDFAVNEEFFRKNREEARDALAQWARDSGEVMAANLPDFSERMGKVISKGLAGIHKTEASLLLEKEVMPLRNARVLGSDL